MADIHDLFARFNSEITLSPEEEMLYATRLRRGLPITTNKSQLFAGKDRLL